MGLFRLFLALFVIAGHSLAEVFGVIGTTWSAMAVFVFFVISGFYMALVMDTKYKDTPVSAFYFSRAARIFPTYWLAAIFSFASLYYMFGSIYFVPFKSVSFLDQVFILFTNLFVFGQDLTYLLCFRNLTDSICLTEGQYLLNAPGWSISVELIFYLIAPFFVRGLWRSALLLCIGLVYVFVVKELGVSAFQEFFNNPGINDASIYYYFFPVSFTFFGAGACSYYAIYKVGAGKSHITTLNYIFGVFVLFAASQVFTPMISWWWTALIAFMVPGLFSATKSNKYDRMIGELSYPVYMFHFPIMVLFRTYQIGVGSIGLGNAVAIASIAAGILVYVAVDRPIDKWRHAMTQRKILGKNIEVSA
ncbi:MULTISPECIES: acyltransferase [unclassified Pseudomonas]|uniref:acyltransferase family protein n=1 Tax=unclassified Pseudomonas TaxID=196821 RepID=UPI000A1DB800|nr:MULTISPECIES: acyltransferase [unclassified Pseudomonas]